MGVSKIQAYCTLLAAVVAISSLGPLIDFISGVPATVKVVWRTQVTLLTTIIPAAIWMYRGQRWKRLSGKDVLDAVLLGGCYALWMTSFIVSLDYTSAMEAVMFSEMHAGLALIGRFFMCKRLSKVHLLALLTLVLGVGACMHSKGGSLSAAQMYEHMFGNALALGGSFFGLIFLLRAKPVTAKFGLFGSTAVNSAVTLALDVALTYILPQQGMAADPLDMDSGVLGWTHFSFNRLGALLTLVFLANWLGMMGYQWSASNLPPVVVSAMLLLEPVIAAVIAGITRLGPQPDLLAYGGCGLLLMSSTMIAYVEAKKADAVVAESPFASRGGREEEEGEGVPYVVLPGVEGVAPVYHPNVKSPLLSVTVDIGSG